MKYLYNTNVFTNSDATSYYLLGVYMTDGNISSAQSDANITSIDKDWLESIRDLICPNKPLIKDRKYFKLSLTNKIIVNWLISNNCTPKKTFSLELPNIPKEFLFDFIRGLIDGDGNISFTPQKRNKVSCNLVGASYSFMNSLNEEFKKMGFKFSFVTIKGGDKRNYKNHSWITKELYRISFYGTNTYKLLQQIYHKNHKLCLNRKKILADNIFQYYEKNKNNLTNRELNVGCKIQWLDNDSLIALVKENGFSGASKKLLVSSSSIRNRLKVRGLLKDIKAQPY